MLLIRGPLMNPSAFLECGLGLGSSWLRTGWRHRLKSEWRFVLGYEGGFRAEACDTYVFPLMIYQLSVLFLCNGCRKVFEHLLFSFSWGARKRQVCKDVCAQHPYHERLGIPHLVSHRLSSMLTSLCCALSEDSNLEGSFRDAFHSFTITNFSF